MKKRVFIIASIIIAVILVAFTVFALSYYRAGPTASAALRSDGAVTVTETDYGWFFDGPSDDDAWIFYPGANVEAAAYAPLLHSIAENGMDVCLVEMPLHVAALDIGKAEDIIAEYDYERWYVGGHSHGGAMAAYWAADHGGDISGVILLAAYPTKPLDDHLTEILIYGSEDKIVDAQNLNEGRNYAPADFTEYVIPGGNHAQFGDYGPQKGDGTALIDRDTQIEETVEVILSRVRP